MEYAILHYCIKMCYDFISYFANVFTRILGTTKTVLSNKGKILATIDTCQYQPVGCARAQ